MNNDQSKKREKNVNGHHADDVCTNKCPNRKMCTTKMTIEHPKNRTIQNKTC